MIMTLLVGGLLACEVIKLVGMIKIWKLVFPKDKEND